MIHLSQAAIDEILRLKQRRKNSNLLMRLGVEPSNCLNFSYTLEFDDVVGTGEQVYQFNEVQVLVRQEYLSYFNGLRIDFSEDLMGGAFRFHNPNATQICSCGNSFAIAACPDNPVEHH